MVSVLVIDPRKSFRDEIVASLSNWFTVHCARTVTEAANIWSQKRPEAAMASMVQAGDTHGLELLGRLRKTSRGRDVNFIAYGRPGGTVVPDDAIEKACRQYGVSVWIAETLEAPDLQARLLGHLLKLRTFDTQGNLPPIRMQQTPLRLDQTPVMSARNVKPTSVDRIRAIAAGELRVVDKTWAEEEPSWSEMLRSPANGKNLRRMVRKAVTGAAADAASGADASPLDDVGS